MHNSANGAKTPSFQHRMKTQSRHSPVATSPYHTPSHGSRSHRVTKNSTSPPITSPKPPYSVCQNYPPMLSPTLSNDNGRVPSPNYFGLVIESGGDARDSSGPANQNWSPSSSVKSFAAALPKQITLDSNSEFEAFRKAADSNRGKSFSLTAGNSMPPPTSQPSLTRPRPSRWHTFASDSGSESSLRRFPSSFELRPTNKNDKEADNLHDSAYVSSDSKRNSEASLRQDSSITGMPPIESPDKMETTQAQTLPPKKDPSHTSRFSLSLPRPDLASPRPQNISQAATLPARIEPDLPAMISGARLREIIATVGLKKILVLDVRSAQSFAHSRIKGALNLCIPTTLLKRATFNIQKLQQTFQGNAESQQFSQWQDMDWIIVYDTHASDKRDSVTAQNMIKKFTNEGYSGKTGILFGGFSMISTSFPDLVDGRSTVQSSPQQNSNHLGSLAPVIGGVNLPTQKNDHNPFFSNIRQNMDLADGVGQFDITRPRDLQSPLLPTWLRDAAAESDHGKKVSNKFLNIELEEQSRMRTAYAAFNPNHQSHSKFQLSGVEKGTKNRYKDILPFDHARVRLQETSEGSCDYVNASYLSAARSNKRYIASQGPLPTTFQVSHQRPRLNYVSNLLILDSLGLLVCRLGTRRTCHCDADRRE